MSPTVSLRVLAVMILGVVGKADEVENAMRLLYTGKINEGIAVLRTAAANENVPAQLWLGKVYGGSKIHKEDYAEAMKWYRRASALGSGEASALVAELYESGLGVAASAEEARKWWEIAASQGWDQQQMTVQCLELKDVQDGKDLSCRASSDIVPCPSTEKMALLREAGLRGVLIPNGSGGGRFRKGPKAEALIVINAPVKVPVTLKQPRHTTAVYFQDSGSWKHFPADVPMLGREIVIGPQDDGSRYVSYSVKDVGGSTTGGGCAIQP